MKTCISIILLFACFASNAQSADFIVLKKKGKTVQSFYTGKQIEFTTKDGVYKNAEIIGIANDSIFIREYITRQAMTSMGFYVIDTAGSVASAYPYQSIGIIGRKQSGFNWNASGYALLGGGILLTLASGVVYLADRDKFSPELMGASAGLAFIGYFLAKSGGKGIVIGKKGYSLEYMKMSSVQP